MVTRRLKNAAVILPLLASLLLSPPGALGPASGSSCVP